MERYVKIKPQELLLVVESGETVLDAALRSGFEFPYSCGSATCGSCMGKVLSGHIDYGNVDPYALDKQARDEGFALFCSAHPTTDLTIEVEDVYGSHYVPPSKIDYEVLTVKKLNHGVHIVQLFPKKKSLKYTAGQYIQIVCKDGVLLPFSIANAPNEKGMIELHIREASDNPYAVEVIKKLQVGETLTLRGPEGNMIYRESPNLPVIFIAGGVGIAPLKAIIEQYLLHHDQRELHLYWGVKSIEHAYLNEEFEALAKQHPQLKMVSLVDNNAVHKKVLEDISALSDKMVYVAGPVEMVHAAFDYLTHHGVKPQLMFSDTFQLFPK